MDPKLYEAAASGDLNFLQTTEQNIDVLQVTKHQQNSVLHIAVKFKQVEFCKQILQSSSSSFDLLTKSNSKGKSALHVAAKIGCLEIAKLLVDCPRGLSGDVENSRVNARSELLRMVNQEKDTALHVAVRNGHFAVAKYLIEADQGLFDTINDANVCLLCLAIEGGFSEIANFILGKFPDSPDGEINIKTALHSAVIHSQHATVKLLLEKIPNSRNETDRIGWTPLHYAAFFDDLKSTKMLLQGHISTAYIVDQDGTSALHVAAFKGHINVVELFVQHSPEIHEVTDNKGRTLLHAAVIGGQGKMVRRILEMPMLLGIINEKDNDGNTALHLAVINKRDYIITLLARNREMDRAMLNNNLFTASDIFSLQRRKTSFLVEKIRFWLPETHGLQFIQEWINTKIKRKMIGKTDQKDTNILFSSGKEDQTGTSTATPEGYDETKWKNSLEVQLLIATLIATVTFQAAFTVPGGYKDDGPDEGTAQFTQKAAFKAFVVFDTIAFVFSTATVLIQFATSRQSYYSRSRYATLAEVMIFIALIGMLIAFASALYVEVANSIGLRLIAYVMVATFYCVYQAIKFVDPLGPITPRQKRQGKYLRDLLFRYGII
ncbi:hypothetical protein PTKIN_Ptkin01aG0345400 [Pterospermum kingtungense]